MKQLTIKPYRLVLLFLLGLMLTACSNTAETPAGEDAVSEINSEPEQPICNWIDDPTSCQGWVCYEDERGTVCDNSRPDRPDGRPGWECSDDAFGVTQCTRTDDSGGPGTFDNWECQNDDSGLNCVRGDDFGGDDWSCEEDANGMNCTRTDGPEVGPGWECYDDATGTHCEGDPNQVGDRPNGGPWICHDEPDSRVCDDDHSEDEPGQSMDNPTGGPGWTCEDTQDGRECSYGPNNPDDPYSTDNHGPYDSGTGQADTPDGTDDWECHWTDEGKECERIDEPDNGDWDCLYDDGTHTTNCTSDGELPDDNSGWVCYDTENGRHCENSTLDNPVTDETFDDCADPAGNVEGRACVPSGEYWVVGALVSITYTDCNGNPHTLETQTDVEGHFVLTGVRVGTHTLTVRKGPYERTYDVTVERGQTTSIPLADLCFDQSTNIAVVTGQYDKVENVLDHLGFVYDLYVGFPTNEHARQLLEDPELLASYDVIFMDCGTSRRGITDNGNVRNQVAQNLRTYVENGGRMYVSDWDYIFVEITFPEALDFVGEDQTDTDVLVGDEGFQESTIADPELEAVVGDNSAHLFFDMLNWAVLESISQEVRLFLHTDIQTMTGANLRDTPVLVSFRKGLGEVIFTSYHIHENQQMNSIFIFTVLGFGN